MTQFKGLTWDHPRGYAALDRAAAEAGGIIAWNRQPLEGFESAPIEEVCAGHDLVVLDHPHLGDALAAECLQSLDSVVPEQVLADIRARTLGPCYKSYEMDGHLWALPLDAAAQVSAARTDLLTDSLPDSFDSLDRSASREPGFVLSLAGPHAFLTLLSLAAGINSRFGPVDQDYFLPHHNPAIDLFISLAQRSHAIGATHNPIALLEAMAAGWVSFCPFVFGYVNYARGERGHEVAFRDVPVARSGAPPRSVLGGTGIALTRNCNPTPELVDHLVALMSESLQNGLIPETGGQPSAASAWMSPSVNRDANGFYRQTAATLRNAIVRPRHCGFVPTQSRASAWLRENVTTPWTAAAVRAEINRILRQA